MYNRYKYIKIIISLTSIIFIIIMGCIFNKENDYKNERNFLIYTFQIQIIQEIPTEFEIIVPVPVDENNEIVLLIICVLAAFA